MTTCQDPPVSLWPLQNPCYHGYCQDSYCFCEEGWTGRHETLDLRETLGNPNLYSGTDCSNHVLARKIFWSLSCIIVGFTALFSAFRLWTLRPLHWPPSKKEISCYNFLFTYSVFSIMAALILAEDARVHERAYSIVMFWMSNAGLIVNISNKGLMMIHVAFAAHLSGHALQKKLEITCIVAAIIGIVAIAFLQLTAGFLSGNPAAVDGLTAGWIVFAGLVSSFYSAFFFVVGNWVLQLLQKAMDQGPDVLIAIERMKTIRNQMFISVAVPSGVLLVWGCIPAIRVIGSEYIYPTLWMFWSLGNCVWLYGIRKTGESPNTRKMTSVPSVQRSQSTERKWSGRTVDSKDSRDS